MTAPTRVTMFAGAATMLVALSLTPVYATSTWFWHSLGAVIVVGLVGGGLRRTSAPSLVVILIQLLAIFFYLAWLYSDDTIYGLIPGPGTVQDFGSLLRSGLADADTYAPKVPETTGLLLLTVGGVALVDLAVDAAAVTFRRASLAGLPLLALYTVPASILTDGIAWPLFLIGALGFIGLLIAEGQERLVRWGRPLVAGLSAERAGRAISPSRVDTTPFGQVGRRIGAVAIGLAVIVPALLPITDGLLTSGAGGLFGGSGSSGGGTQVRLDPMVTMRRAFRTTENIEVARMITNAANPAELYLRMATLDVFDGLEWKPSRLVVDRFDSGLPQETGISDQVARKDVTTQIELTDAFESYYLPVPYPLTSLDISGSWRVERSSHNIVSARGPNQVAGRSYIARSLVLSPTPQQLAEAPAPPIELRRYLELPDQMPPIVGQLASEAAAGATTPYDKALRLQAWLRNPDEFTYSTAPGREGTGLSAIESFLVDRTGYCEQFAATMAVMARRLGIPARVNVGFSAGERVDANTIVVRTHDAHAWPELYFEGAGWVRFEPTPFDPSRGTPPSYVAAPDEITATESPTSSPTTDPSSNPTGGGPSASAGGPSACPLPRPELCEPPSDLGGATTAGSRAWQLVLAIAGAILLLGSVPALLRVGMRRRRWRLAGVDPAARADAAWLELLDTARDLGFAPHGSDTPRQSAARLIKDAKLRARHQEPLLRLTKAVERARYALSPADDATLDEDLAAVRTGLAARAGRVWRVRAIVLPRSTWVVAHWVAERIADALDAIDRTASWVSRRVLRTGRSEATG